MSAAFMWTYPVQYGIYDAHARERQNIRNRALQRLWQGVADELEVRHPDPQCKVVVEFKNEELITGCHGNFVMTNAPDSNDPGMRMLAAFRMNITVRSWPGKRAAALWLLGAWTQYVMHEVTELVTWKEKHNSEVPASHLHRWDSRRSPYPDWSRVIDVHQSINEPLSMHHWDDMGTIQNGRDGWLEKGIGLVIGADAAKQLIEAGAADAAKEFEREVRKLAEPTALTVTAVDAQQGLITVESTKTKSGEQALQHYLDRQATKIKKTDLKKEKTAWWKTPPEVERIYQRLMEDFDREIVKRTAEKLLSYDPLTKLKWEDIK